MTQMIAKPGTVSGGKNLCLQQGRAERSFSFFLGRPLFKLKIMLMSLYSFSFVVISEIVSENRIF